MCFSSLLYFANRLVRCSGQRRASAPGNSRFPERPARAVKVTNRHFARRGIDLNFAEKLIPFRGRAKWLHVLRYTPEANLRAEGGVEFVGSEASGVERAADEFQKGRKSPKVVDLSVDTRRRRWVGADRVALKEGLPRSCSQKVERFDSVALVVRQLLARPPVVDHLVIVPT